MVSMYSGIEQVKQQKLLLDEQRVPLNLSYKQVSGETLRTSGDTGGGTNYLPATPSDTSRVDQLVYQVNQRVDDVKRAGGAKSKQESVPYAKILLTYADRTDKILMGLGYLTAIITGLGLPSFVFLFGDITDEFGKSYDIVDAIRPIAIELTVIGLFIWLTSYFYFAFLVIMSERVGMKTRVAYLKAILQQDISWFDEVNVTELSARLSKECQSITKALGEKMGSIQLSLAMCVSGLFFAFFKGWLMSLILLAFFPVVFLMSHIITVAMQSGFSQNLKSYGQSAGYAEQALNAIRVVQAFGQEDTEIANYDKYLGRARATGVRTHMKTGLAIAGFFLVMFGYYAYAFYTGSFLITNQVKNTQSGQVYTSGDILACFFGVVFGVFSLGMATPNIKAITEGRVAGKVAYDIIERVPKIKMDNEVTLPVGQIAGKIEFKNVTFRYPTRPEQLILDSFTATFEEGKTTAIVGASGSGKSTIIQLIERFYDPECGSITLDGRQINTLNLRELRRKIGYVGQEPVLFNSTIKENLLYADPKATDDQIIEALKSANAWDFINQKMGEHGINTNVGNAGGQLSGGQKQRIAIARAFIKKPKILLLDEATSALDKKNEQEVQSAIDQIRKDLGSITTVVIAHRLSTIRNADNIIVMQKGRIIEQGNHDQLLRDYPEGLYAKFVREQQQSEQENNNTQTETIGPEIQQTKGRQFKKKGVYESQEEIQMKEKHDALDKEKMEESQMKEEQIKKANNFMRLSRMSEPKINIFFGLFVSILQGSLLPIFGIFLGKMLFILQYVPIVNPLDKIRSDSDFYCLMMLIVSIASFFTGFSQKFSFGVIGENVTLKIRRQLYGSILSKHMGWFDDKNNSPGVLSATMASDAQTINGVSAEGLAASMEAMCAVLVGVVIGFVYNWQISVVCLLCVPFMILGSIMNIKFQSGMSSDTDSAMRDANLLAGDSIINYRTVASFANEDQILQDFERHLQGPVNIAINKCHLIGCIFGFSQFVQYAVFAVLYYFGAVFQKMYFDDHPINPFDPNSILIVKKYSEEVFIAIFAMMFGAMAAGQAQQFGPDLGKAKTSAQKIFGIMDMPTEISIKQRYGEDKKAIKPSEFKGTIEFVNVWFRYPTRRNDWVLKGLNMRINQNETVALVGESGCGKSTIVSLILRFYDINEGCILVDGIDVRHWDLQELRLRMGLVMQEPTLFNYSVAENILYGKPNAYNSQIREATSVANANEFIESHHLENAFDDSAQNLHQELINQEMWAKAKMGEDSYKEALEILAELKKDEAKKGTFVAIQGDIDKRGPEMMDLQLHPGFNIQCGIKGSKLSGGQKQRIAIARAIIRRPQILILDEATSALDEESQRKVQVALDNIMKERTSIVIAHRLTTIEKCDRIMVLESGRLVEEGAFTELKLKDGGIFAQLASGMQNPCKF